MQNAKRLNICYELMTYRKKYFIFFSQDLFYFYSIKNSHLTTRHKCHILKCLYFVHRVLCFFFYLGFKNENWAAIVAVGNFGIWVKFIAYFNATILPQVTSEIA